MEERQSPVICRIGKRGRGRGQFLNPCGVAVTHTGDIIVVDTENHRIQIFNENGNFKSKFGSKGCRVDQLSYPLCVAMTPEDHIAITDSVNACVKVFSVDGQLVRIVGENNTFDFPYGIDISCDGYFVVTDIFKHCVMILDKDGNNVKSFGKYGSEKRDFDHPYFVSIDTNKQITISDSGNCSIKIFSFEGKILRMFIHNDFKLVNETFFNLQGMCIDGDNNTLVICNNTIYILTKNGRLWEVLRPSDGLFCPRALACSSSGALIVTQNDTNKRHEVTLFRYNKDDFKSLNSLQYYAISL